MIHTVQNELEVVSVQEVGILIPLCHMICDEKETQGCDCVIAKCKIVV